MVKKQSTCKKFKAASKDMLESFSPWTSLGKVIPTSKKVKEDIFESYRPTKQCVDYTISETYTKFQSGDIKVNVKQTTATYKDIPEEICRPKKDKKVKHSHGAPPQWKFLDEIWREHVDKIAKKMKVDKKLERKKVNLENNQKRERYHNIVQELVGPDWFMELCPQQLSSLDQLRQRLSLDIRKRTTENTQELLAELGLVLRPNKEHVSTAIKHSCGCPVEFLLVLYQLINPRRTEYSLNDRLILSGVVHLSIAQTLRELHIRIPSPPRIIPEEREKHHEQKKKKVRYKSPYLQPLTYDPPPPKFSGIYRNKHRQRPESPYFSYLYFYELDKIHNDFCFNYSMHAKDPAKRARVSEYQDAQQFYESLPGVKKQMLQLIPPTSLYQCPNMLHPRPKVDRSQLQLARLCKVSVSEPDICFCKENDRGSGVQKEIKRSCCEKHAEKYLGSICWCDNCLEEIATKSLVRVHGGLRKAPCYCDEPVPIIEGTLLNRTCDCFKEYRNKIVSAAARQNLQDRDKKYVISGVVLTPIGPIYNILTTLGKKICNCDEIRRRKNALKLAKQALLSNEAKFVIGGVTMTKNGPVYNLLAVAARKPCKCLLKYHYQLGVLAMQNEIRQYSSTLVNQGLINSAVGPVFNLGCVIDPKIYKKPFDLEDLCPCSIKKPICFTHCQNYFDYTETVENSTSKSTLCESSCEETSYTSSDRSQSSKESSSATSGESCPYCHQTPGMDSSPTRKCARQDFKNQETQSSTSSTFSESSTSLSTSTDYDTTDNGPKPNSKNEALKEEPSPHSTCKCKEELEHFMKSKCPCEECNRKIRQANATYVVGSTRTTPSGHQVNVVQGIHQPECACLHDHIENIRRVDEYKSRIKVRHDLKKQPHKYCVSGVTNTREGPVYIISGLRPPVDCECARALREKEEQEMYEKQRAKMPNTGRIKYAIQGVRATSKENVYIMSGAVKPTKCECENLLSLFEDAHKSCMEEYEQFLKQKEQAIQAVDNDDLVPGESGEDELPNEPSNEGEEASEGEQASEEKQEETKEPEEHMLMNKETEEPEEHVPMNTHQEQVQQNVVGENTNCESCSSSSLESSTEETESSENESSKSESSEIDSSECGSCHVENPPDVKPIQLRHGEENREFFLSKRFAIFRKFPRNYKRQMEILTHILNGMAEDGFPLAKLPHVHKLPIFKLWMQMRAGISWTYDDRIKYILKSRTLWKHTFTCYRPPNSVSMPFTKAQARKITWRHAEFVRLTAAKKMEEFYRNLKQSTVETGREMFASTFSYEFPTTTWRDCFFAYTPSKEEHVFPYKIYQPHDVRYIPENKKMRCY
ncbi:uncharacterized protein LOC115875539 [Sitophilus oryzae]|uniref:Uncharacterized protein LOC115875539 n=1 Tax=Sitophilus oryzae TaxID=7048 RepID=A0A6J2X6U2_SITOR|nr:uncharacterized protein LOC115875539 [Sitophilus oryzae]